MKNLTAILFSALAVSSYAGANDGREIVSISSDAYSQCLVQEFSNHNVKPAIDSNHLASSVSAACQEELRTYVENLYIRETSDPNKKPGSESRHDFMERVTAEEENEAKVLIESWISESK